MTFAAKPVYGDNGSFMHVHQFIGRGGNAYAHLSETGLHCIGGIIQHAKAIDAPRMAGYDDIANNIDPGEPMDRHLNDLPLEGLKYIPTRCGSLQEASGTLQTEHNFLSAGQLFGKEQTERCIELKWAEIHCFDHTRHPAAFEI